MTYVDGYLLAVPTANKKAYLTLAEEVSLVFKDHGALSVVENWGDDIPDGEVTSFPMAVKCMKDETVVFSWVVWPSKDVRDAGMKKSMEDPRMKGVSPESMPFDGKRLIFGGFETIVDK
ncbi:DUF1428 domain-containing protein [Exilibacterium tricleocarpae]|uniref:DUF1428 domain-containing protein n=1 Tax=Exilibacterium tricleocarpae TaxID=2591008 RepID=A0A545U9I2_9GAMM|nr:DUF1428 domain-containing protein [Exilibacterium tricleocarpae]TQV86121.1 DUF1428 domain-containing protein [Exilibacterium tricleocarpae]